MLAFTLYQKLIEHFSACLQLNTEHMIHPGRPMEIDHSSNLIYAALGIPVLNMSIPAASSVKCQGLCIRPQSKTENLLTGKLLLHY